ncbi:MAG TPA: UvrD-helicase domain-containing protein [Thermoanaerobaculia bacterium]|nr:UvrD-helicase domain-containing protein [Thermoanaerobaculia bacterium]
MRSDGRDGRPLADDPARRSIAEDLGTTMLVEAAAGTGKTTCLVDRMVALVATGAAPIERISAVTFTIRAAAQLSQRFQNELESRREKETDPISRERLDTALASLDAAFLGTIHAFCARLLRERPVEAAVDPDFREMDEPEDAVARDAAWNRFAQRLFAEDSPSLARLAQVGVKLEDLHDTYEALVENADVEPALAREIAPPDLTAARRRFEEFLDRAVPLLPAEAGPKGWTSFEQAVRKALRLRQQRDLTRAPQLVKLLEPFKSRSLREKAPHSLRPALDSLRDEFVKPALTRWCEHVYPIVVPVLVAARDDYRLWRRRNGRLNFQDLLLEARNLLRDRPDVRSALRSRFTPILVDEFQDTDPIQAEILFYLTGTDDREKDWRRIAPAPGALFVVGDPKQSIYRFRRADIETYDLVRRRIEESGGRVVELSTNFRSTPALCEWVNRAFGRPETFPETRTPKQPSYVPLVPHRRSGPPAPAVVRLDVPASGSESEPVVLEDADRIGRFIAVAVERGERSPGDFLVLFRRRRYMGAYARALEQRGVPYEIAGGGALAESRELTALLPILRSIADPDDPIPFAAALRGPVFGVDDDALYRFSRLGGRFRFTAEPPERTDSRIVRAVALIRRAAEFVETLPPAAAISRTAGMLGLLPLAAAAELGESRAGNFLKALAAARNFSAEGLDFAGVVGELERLGDGDTIEQMSLEPGRPGVVRLMTLHGAKGLEAKVVFLAEPAHNPRIGRNYWIDRSVEPPVGHFRVFERVGSHGENDIALPPDWESKCEIEEEFERAEAARLLYVGATRAEDMLVVSIKRTATGKPSGPWAPLDAFLAADLPRQAPVLASAPRPVSGLGGERDAAASLRAARRNASSAPTLAAVSVTALSHAAGDKPAWEATGRGMSWGRVLHGVLEALMRDPAADVRAIASNLLAEEERPAGELDEVVRLAADVAKSPLWTRARAAKRTLVEVPFAIDVPREELGLTDGPPRTLLQGAIDLVFEEDDGWVLVDYKSDAVTPENRTGLVAFYTPQVDTYRRYWRQLTGRPTRAGIFFAQTGDTEWIPDAFTGPSSRA